MRIHLFEKWSTDEGQKGWGRRYEIPGDAASLDEAIRLFSAESPRPAEAHLVYRDVREDNGN